MIASILAAVTALASAGAQVPGSLNSSPDSLPDRLIVAVNGGVNGFGSEPDDWLRLSGVEARFMLPHDPERESIWLLVDLSQAEAVSLSVRTNAAAGRLAATGDHLIYPICSVTADGHSRIGDEARNCPSAPVPDSPSERLLVLGFAAAQQDPVQARRWLGGALDSQPELPPRARLLALKARAQAAEWIADGLDPVSIEHDRLVAEALADYRQLADERPDLPGVRMAIARALQALGDYAEAHRIYRAVEREWPRQAWEVAVQQAALYRQEGNYRRALRRLDAATEFAEPGEAGMKFHYHRAWTLMLLGRLEEALEDVSRGLASQPDYGAAYQLRACVRARLGRLEEALADQRRALEILAGAETEMVGGAIERGRAGQQALETALAEGRSEAVAAPCHGHWERWSRPRMRSSLLGS